MPTATLKTESGSGIWQTAPSLPSPACAAEELILYLLDNYLFVDYTQQSVSTAEQGDNQQSLSVVLQLVVLLQYLSILLNKTYKL